MPFSKETLQRIARELWATEVAPADAEEALVWLTPALDGLAELDALDLEALEPAVTFALPAPGAAEGPAAPEGR
ncbi:MAG TPA: hypothetical protein VIG69_01440 [Candidatus Methylomirabilis sp.]|jgi:hypothetical protein